MIDAELLVAFALVTAAVSVVPGPSMLFVLGQAAWHGARQGILALVGLQLGYVVWFILAGLGLGTLAVAFPLAFRLLAIGGALYLVWLGIQAWRHAGTVGEDGIATSRPSRHAFRDGVVVALGNPKSLIYIVAILPPFVDSTRPIAFQLVVLAAAAMAIDLALGAIYILAGNSLAKGMKRPGTRKWIDRTVGALFILIAVAILAELLSG